MVHDLVKFGLSIIVLALLVIVMVLFVSGYLSAFNTGGKSGINQTSVISGGQGGHINNVKPSPMAKSYGGMMAQGAQQSWPAQPAPEYNMQPMLQQQLPTLLPGTGGNTPMGPSQEITPSVTPSITPSIMPSTVPPAGANEGYVPTSYEAGWNNIIQQLLQMLPFIFSGRFCTFPVWPQFFW